MPTAEELTVETAPDIQVRKKLRLEAVLGIILLFCVGLLIGVVLLCLPYFGQSETVTEPTTTQPTTGSTLPPAEEDLYGRYDFEKDRNHQLFCVDKNPYGRNDFQYGSNNYLYCTKGQSVAGIDVSKHQGKIDWQQVADSGIQFAMIRVANRGYGMEGNLVEDPYARANLQGAHDAGLDVGVYIFSQALSEEEALEEAEFLLNILKDFPGVVTLPVVFDWERVSREDSRTDGFSNARLLTDCTIAFCERIKEAGYEPMVYFNTYQSNNLLHMVELKRYPFWLALYSDRMRYPYKVDMWQYTDSGTVPGIDGPVDLNVWMLHEYG